MKLNKIYIYKFIFLLIGIYLFTLGLSLYLPTAVGVMHLDFTIYSVLMGWKGVISDPNSPEYGTLEASVSNGIYYELVLGFYFFIIALISVTFLIISEKRKKEFNKIKTNIKSKILFIFLADITIVFLEPLFLMMHEKLYITEEVVNFIKHEPYQIRLWIFMCGFLLTAIGDAIWIKTNLFLGPYNSIVPNFQKMTNWNYISSRILIDLAILIPGLIISLSITSIDWNIKAQFFLDYLNIGTILFILGFGPIVHAFEKIINVITQKVNNKFKIL